jgi:hypothetical protein
MVKLKLVIIIAETQGLQTQGLQTQGLQVAVQVVVSIMGLQMVTLGLMGLPVA